jgi:hypothetical protein
MSGLQEAFYIVGIVYMGISLLLIFGLVIAVGVIRKKIVALEKTISDKIDFVTSLPAKVEGIVDTVRHLTKHGSK